MFNRPSMDEHLSLDFSTLIMWYLYVLFFLIVLTKIINIFTHN
jgi:hypothetical protein